MAGVVRVMVAHRTKAAAAVLQLSPVLPPSNSTGRRVSLWRPERAQGAVRE